MITRARSCWRVFGGAMPALGSCCLVVEWFWLVLCVCVGGAEVHASCAM